VSKRTIGLCVAAAVVGVVAVVGEFWYLQTRQQAQEAQNARQQSERTIAAANEQVASHMQAARTKLAAHNWDAALNALAEARSVEAATNKDGVEPLILEAERGQAAALFDDALTALRRRDSDQSLRSLQAYLNHPRAGEADRAKALQAEILRAVGEGHAVAYLRRLSDARLTQIAAKGDDPAMSFEDAPIKDERVRPLFLETLRRSLPAEQRRRAELREAERAEGERKARKRAEQEARVRGSNPYREIVALVDGLRRQYRDAQAAAERRNQALTRMFQELNIKDADEQAKYRQEFGVGPSKRDEYRQTLLAKRAGVKKAFQKLPDFDAEERELFEQMIDEVTDALLIEMKKS
jgi:hypothetical protein